jgi:hypothetical protein
MRTLLLVLALAGCKKQAEPSCDAAALDAVHTVVRVTIESETEPTVTYGLTEAKGSTARVTETGEGQWEALLLGTPALSDVFWSVEAGGAEICHGAGRTEGLPSGLPDLTVTVDQPELQDPDARWIIAASIGDATPILIFDRQANVVWYRETEAGMQPVETQLLPDGTGFWQNSFADDRTVDAGMLRRVGWDGETVEEFETPLAHHVFTLLPDGTLAWLVIDVREWTDTETGATESVVGDAIVERSPDGTIETVFSVWDALDVTKNNRWLVDFYPQGRDWTHGNALHWDESADSWWLSLGHEQNVLVVPRDTTEVSEVYGTGEGLKTDATVVPVAEGSLMFEFQHDVHRLPDGNVLMFATHPEEKWSGAIEYAVQDGALTQVWDFGLSERSGYSALLGQATRLGNGNTLINYGGTGLLREVTPDGTVVWELQTAAGTWFGQVHAFNDFLGE